MTAITGTLEDHRAVRDSWAVGSLHVESAEGPSAPRAGSTITVRGGRLGLAQIGEKLKLVCSVEDHPRWGLQFEILEQESMGIVSGSEAHRWLERLDGVGPKLARAIYKAFGEQVLELLKDGVPPGHPDPLLEVEGVGPTLAQTIRESWLDVGASGDPEELRYLDGLGLSRYEVNLVMGYCKRRHPRIKPQDLLGESPYELLKVKGFGWVRTDKIAMSAGAAKDSPARLDAAVTYQVERSCDGPTVVSQAQLIADTCKLTGCAGGLVGAAIDRQAERGAVVAFDDETNKRWVSPKELMQAERSIFRATREPGRICRLEASSDQALAAACNRELDAVLEAERPVPTPPRRVSCWCEGPCGCQADPIAELRAAGEAKRAKEAERVA